MTVPQDDTVILIVDDDSQLRSAVAKAIRWPMPSVSERSTGCVVTWHWRRNHSALCFVIVGGLITSTILTLLLLPVLYMFLHEDPHVEIPR